MIDRQAWLEQRRELITASDAAAILGFDDRRNAYDIWCQKVYEIETPDNDAMLCGRCLEDGIAQIYAAKTGREVVNPGPYVILRHPVYSWLAATLDRYTWALSDDLAIDKPKPLEIKNLDIAKTSEWDGLPPLKVQTQLQIQIACIDAPWGSYAGLIGGNRLLFGDLERDDAFLEFYIPQLEDFRRRVIEKDPPDITAPSNLWSVKQVHQFSFGNGQTVNLEGKEILENVNVWEAQKQIEKVACGIKAVSEAKIRAAMGDHSFATLADGTMLKRIGPSGYVKRVRRK